MEADASSSSPTTPATDAEKSAKPPPPLLHTAVFWDRCPASAPIACVLLAQGGGRVVTGDTNGLLLIWRVLDAEAAWVGHSRRPGVSLRPFLVIDGALGPIVHLCECLSDEGPAVCCLHSDGTLAIYALGDGGCVGVFPHLAELPTACVPLPGLRHVAVAANAMCVPVLSVASHLVVCLLKSLSPVISIPPSLPDLSSGAEADSSDMMVTLCTEGHIQYWDFRSIVSPDGPAKMEHFSEFTVRVPTRDSERVCACDQTDQCDLVLIVCSNCCHLYLYRASTPLFTLNPPSGVSYTGGRFVGGTHVVLLCDDGTAEVHELAPHVAEMARQRHRASCEAELALHREARAAIMQRDPSGGGADDGHHTLSGMISGLFWGSPRRAAGPVGGGQRIPAETAAATGLAPPIDIPPPTTASFFEQFSRLVSVDPFLSDVSDPDMGSWQDAGRSLSLRPEGDDFLDPAVAGLPVSSRETLRLAFGIVAISSCAAEGRPLVITAGTHSLAGWWPDSPAFQEAIPWVSLASAWNASAQDGAETQWLEARGPASGGATATRLSLRHRRLVRGFPSGDVTVLDCCGTTSETWKAHDSLVTALLVDEVGLVTAAADGSVKVWGLEDHTLLAAFQHHVGPVCALIPLPPDARVRLGTFLCSVGADRALVLYDLGNGEGEILTGHGGEVQGLHWVGDGDFALVLCSDGLAYVWDLARCTLLRVLSAAEGESLLLKEAEPGEAVRHVDGPPRRPPKPLHLRPSRPVVSKRHVAFAGGGSEVPMAVVDIRALLLSLPGAGRGFATPRSCPLTCPVSPLTGTKSLDFVEPVTPLTAPVVIPLDPDVATALTLLFEPDHHPAFDKLRVMLNLSGGLAVTPSVVPRGSCNPIAALRPALDGATLQSLSPITTATRSIAAIAVLNALTHNESLKGVCRECIHYYTVHVPKTAPHYRRPAFSWCATWLADPSPDVKFAARCVMNAALKQRRPKPLQTLAVNLAAAVRALPQQDACRHANAVALAVMCCQAGEHVPPDAVQVALESLLAAVDCGGGMRGCAVSLLAEGYRLFQPHIRDHAALARTLFELTVAADDTHVLSPGGMGTGGEVVGAEPETARAATAALAAVAEAHPRLFLDAMEEALGQARMPRQAHAINCIAYTIKRCPGALSPHLFRVIGLVLKVLDPHMPSLRDYCLPTSTVALRTAVHHFDTVVFQQPKQRLAVGDPTGQVIVYNMRTATKWTMWAAHERGVTAMQFSPNGDFLATYCNGQACVKVWQYEGASVLGMPSSPKLLKMFPVAGNQPAAENRLARRGAPALTWTGGEVSLAGFTAPVPSVTFTVGFGG